MRKIFSNILLSIFVIFNFIFAEPQIGRQVFSGDFLQQSGITRLSDILKFAGEWTLSTTSGMRYYANVSGLDLEPASNWQIMLDGQIMDLQELDVNNLNALPVSIDLIDSVEIYSDPALVEGNFAGHGIIHIHTKQIKDGIAIKGFNNIGNETGDPGPYVFTKYSSPNVDRLGPNFSLSADAATHGLGMRISFQNQNHYSTDPDVLARHPNLNIKFARGQLLSPMLQLQLNRQTINAKAYYYQSTSAGKYGFPDWGREFVFISQFRQEFPLQVAFAVVGYQFNWQVSNTFRVIHSANINEQKIYFPDPTIFNLNPNWHLQNHRYKIGILIDQKKWRLQSGLNIIQKQQKNTGYELNSIAHYLDLEFQASENIEQQISFNANTQNEGEIYLSTNTRYYLNNRQIISLQLYYFNEDKFPNEDIWIDTIFVSKAINLQENIQSKPQNWGGRIGHNFTVNRQISTKFSLIYRGFRNSISTQTDFVSGYASNWYSKDVNVENLELKNTGTGHIIAASAGLQLKQAEKFKQNLYFYFIKDLSSNTSGTYFNSKKQPTFQLTYNGWLKIADSFSIVPQIKFISGSAWEDFETLKWSRTHLPAKSIADIAFHKTIWKKRIWLNMTIRNIFNQEERYHPLGARFNLRWYTQLGFNLDVIKSNRSGKIS